MKRPICGRCQRLGTTCRFETRKWTFVDQNENTTQTNQLIGVSQHSLNRTNSALQADAQFWTIYLPQENADLDGCIGGVMSHPWIPTVRNLAEQDTDVRVALQACVFAGLGWIREDRTLVMHAAGLYAQALKQTNIALQYPISACNDSVLACCRLLSLFEMFRRISSFDTSQNQANSWQSHVAGTCRIVELRGRQRHLSGHGLHLYDGVRMTAVINGFMKRRPNKFTTLAWNMPRQTMRDELFELVSTIPELFEQFDIFHEQLLNLGGSEVDDKILAQAESTHMRSLQVCDELHQWESNVLELCKGQSPRETGVSADTDDTALFDVCTSHGDGFFAICTQYWAFCIIFYGSLRMFHQQVNSMTENTISPLPSWVDPEHAAHNIAQTALHFFRPQAGLWSAQSAVLPISSALFYFSRTGRSGSPIARMLLDAFATSKTGVVMDDFLKSMMMKSR